MKQIVKKNILWFKQSILNTNLPLNSETNFLPVDKEAEL